jgi:hypothetical protein
LVLRFFAVKNALADFGGSVRDWLDDYMEAVLLGKTNFDFDSEYTSFTRLFDFLGRVMGPGAFVRYRGNQPVGALAPAYFEAVAIGTLRGLQNVESSDPTKFQRSISDAVQSDTFRSFTGPGANSREKLENRISTIHRAIAPLHS